MKIITTAEGGMALTQRRGARGPHALLRSHGITRDPGAMLQRAPEGPWYYEQQALGFNYRMTDLQAALGLSQLERLARTTSRAARRWRAVRRALLAADCRCDLALAASPTATSCMAPLRRPSQLDAIRRSHREVFERAARSSGIGVNVHYIPVHIASRTTARWASASATSRRPSATTRRRSACRCIPTLTEAQQDRVAAALREALA